MHRTTVTVSVPALPGWQDVQARLLRALACSLGRHGMPLLCGYERGGGRV
jgi:hypothetical protein